MRCFPLVAVLLLSSLLCFDASAQTGQGRLTGIITDAQHAVLSGVTAETLAGLFQE
ncbi:MAG TPA: hypothetical protein VMS04_12300 [Vicinamibacterales bacterium]|jgi:regulator of extracellular matrix RemA (YlzA/DUF370 family)|nr:hypothetical protein [Vicinamibacterales bacterium]